METDVGMETGIDVSMAADMLDDTGQLSFSEPFVSLQDCASVVKPLSEEPPRGHSEILLRSVHGLLCSRDLLDVVIQCMDGICSAHRLVLAAFSPMLQVLLLEGAAVSHNQPLCVVLDEVRHCDLQVLINFMYTGCLLVSDVSPALYEAAQQLGMLDLIKRILGDVTAQNTDDDDEKQVSSLTEDLQQSGCDLDKTQETNDGDNHEQQLPDNLKLTGYHIDKMPVDSLCENTGMIEGETDFVGVKSKEESVSVKEEAMALKHALDTSETFCKEEIDDLLDSSISERTRHRKTRRPVKGMRKKRTKIIATSQIIKLSKTTKKTSPSKNDVPDKASDNKKPTKKFTVKNSVSETPKKSSKATTIPDEPMENKRDPKPEDTLPPEPEVYVKIDGVYKCEKCKFTCKKENSMSGHMKKVHSDIKPFVCSVCERGFKAKRYLTEHMRVHTGERPFPCSVCGAKFSAAKNRTRHMRAHTGELNYTCDECGKSYTSSTTLKKHRLTHSKHRPHRCTEEGCEYSTADKALLRAHMTHKHNVNRQLILCDSCGRSFKTRQSLKCHVLAAHEAAIFSCPRCDYKSRFQTAITSHLKRIHGLNRHGGVAAPTFQCDLCEFGCFTKHELTRHSLNHRGEKPFTCPVCPFATVEKMNLKFHMRTHTGEKPHECKICHRKFPRSMGLKRHMMVHSAEKPYQCEHCGASYADKRSLQTHRYVKHLHIRPFLCHLCSFSAVKKDLLSQHLARTHHIETLRKRQRRVAKESNKALGRTQVQISGDLGDCIAMEKVVVENEGERMIIHEVGGANIEGGATGEQYGTFAVYSMDGNTVELTPILLQENQLITEDAVTDVLESQPLTHTVPTTDTQSQQLIHIVPTTDTHSPNH